LLKELYRKILHFSFYINKDGFVITVGYQEAIPYGRKDITRLKRLGPGWDNSLVVKRRPWVQSLSPKETKKKKSSHFKFQFQHILYV
jgi:hypothetical protein